jgi:hypothetical protein
MLLCLSAHSLLMLFGILILASTLHCIAMTAAAAAAAVACVAARRSWQPPAAV